jgi:hypothetical protein
MVFSVHTKEKLNVHKLSNMLSKQSSFVIGHYIEGINQL